MMENEKNLGKTVSVQCKMIAICTAGTVYSCCAFGKGLPTGQRMAAVKHHRSEMMLWYAEPAEDAPDLCESPCSPIFTVFSAPRDRLNFLLGVPADTGDLCDVVATDVSAVLRVHTGGCPGRGSCKVRDGSRHEWHLIPRNLCAGRKGPGALLGLYMRT
jgi:hypothetical protein